ncbi:MAG: hypothetical protein KC425_00320, partial [Anaerolineales bacterium]|nr:hypothetical protein [Anaerolineales bacterium]
TVRRLLPAAALWLVGFAGVVLLLYPALWATPGAVLRFSSSNANRHLEEALRPTFFLGKVTYDHGPLFYPVVLLWRIGPLALAGLLPGAWLLWRRRAAWRAIVSMRALPAWLLLAWAVLFVAGISVAAKKFDRYLLPALPALTLLAAWAWARLADALRRGRWLLPGLALLQAVYVGTAVPYLLTTANPLVGGSRTAARVLTVGWGEGISAAAQWLAANAAPETDQVAAGLLPAVAPFFPGAVRQASGATVPLADYLIVSLAGEQTEPAQVAAWTAGKTLVHTVRFNGLAQAWVYREPAPQPDPLAVVPLPQPVQFGPLVQVWGRAAATTYKQVDVRLQWGLAAPAAGRFTLQLAVVDAAGQVWAQREAELVSDVAFYPADWAAGERPVVTYDLRLPAGMPPGTYAVELALFDGAGGQLPLLDAGGDFLGVRWQLAEVTVPPAPTPPSVAELNVPVRVDAAWGDRLLLLGHSVLPAQVISGGAVTLDLYWEARQTPPAEMRLSWALGAAAGGEGPLSRYDTGRWRPGERVHEKLTLAIPPDAAAGRYVLMLRGAGEVALGEIEVLATDRLFVLPADMALPLAVRFGDGLRLAGLTPPEPVMPGGQARLTLVWQTAVQPADMLTAFVHVIGPDGMNVAQSDQWPGGLPSVTWAPGQVIVDEVRIDVPADLAPGVYPLGVGVYRMADGGRLAAVDAAGAAVVDDRYVLPVELVVGE